VYTFTEVGR